MVSKYRARISGLEGEMTDIERQEVEERELRATENQMNKARRILEQNGGVEDDKRSWFQTHKERLAEKGESGWGLVESLHGFC